MPRKKTEEIAIVPDTPVLPVDDAVEESLPELMSEPVTEDITPPNCGVTCRRTGSCARGCPRGTAEAHRSQADDHQKEAAGRGAGDAACRRYHRGT